MKAPVHLNSIRTFALVCAAITSGWLIFLTWWLVDLLSGNDWCAIAVGVSEAAEARPIEAVKSCFGLLAAQVDSLSRTLLIALGTLALCLLVLMVIVVAGGKLSFTASKSGVSGNMGRDIEPQEAAQFVADEAQNAADAVPETKAPAADAGLPESLR